MSPTLIGKTLTTPKSGDKSPKSTARAKAPARKKAPARRKAPSRPKKDSDIDNSASNTGQETAATAAPVIDPEAAKVPTFKELGLSPKIIKALDDLGYERPTPIQAGAIPHALQNKDVLGIAQTGTGKTGAFTLPVMHKLSRGRARARMPRCMIICPTRELAAQVAENVELYGKYLKLEMALLIGGVSFAEQEKKLMKGVDILIATPGRLLDQFERGKILLTGVETLVVDEADRMLDMGFIPDIEKIFSLTPFTRQVLFFSATMPAEIKRIVDEFLHRPETVQVARRNMTADTVTQRIVRMPSSDKKQKRTALRWIIDNEDVQNGIVFCNRKIDVDIVAKSLTVHGHSAAPIHGDLAQSLRTQTLEDFKTGKLKLLVASDVAARGLDVPSVSHVFNYDVPTHSEDYVHRIGRTGRAGRKGDTVMLVARLDEKYYEQILDLIGKKSIDELEIPGIEDFPKEDKSRNRKGARGGRGNDRNRQDRKPKRDYAPKKTPDMEQAAMEPVSGGPSKPQTKAAPKSDTEPRKAPGRRKAPSKASSKAPSKSKAPKREKTAKSPDDSRRDDTPKPKHDDRAPRSEDKPKRSAKQRDKNRNEKRDTAPRNAVGRRSIGKADDPGFGDDVPAFFKR